YDRARALATASGDDRVLAIAANNVGDVAYQRGSSLATAAQQVDAETSALLAAAGIAFEQAKAAADRTSDDYLRLRINLNLASLDLLLGRLDSARAALLASRDLAAALGDLGSVALADNNLGRIAMTLDEDEEAEQRLAAALAVAEELGEVALQGEVLYNWALHLKEGTDYRDNIARCRQSIALAEKLGDTATAQQRRYVLGVLQERAQP
ncbi:MAG: hypothetical protein JWN31_657, partial [Frankiales bacterium]|nr:hypothetical protein [Frankiales bacterium]